MEEGNKDISISRGDLIALSHEWSDRDVKYARLEMRYELLEEKYAEKDKALMAERAARIKAEEEAKNLRMQIEKLQQDFNSSKSQVANYTSTFQQPDRDTLKQAIEYLLQNHILISILKLQNFMNEQVSDLNTALMLRSVFLECVPEQLQAASLEIIKKVMALPEKAKPTTIDNRTINMNGDNPVYEEKS